jgi:hypothetical protein
MQDLGDDRLVRIDRLGERDHSLLVGAAALDGLDLVVAIGGSRHILVGLAVHDGPDSSKGTVVDRRAIVELCLLVEVDSHDELAGIRGRRDVRDEVRVGRELRERRVSKHDVRHVVHPVRMHLDRVAFGGVVVPVRSDLACGDDDSAALLHLGAVLRVGVDLALLRKRQLVGRRGGRRAVLGLGTGVGGRGAILRGARAARIAASGKAEACHSSRGARKLQE